MPPIPLTQLHWLSVPVKGNQSLRRVFAAVRKGSEDHPLIRLVLGALARDHHADQ